MTRFAEAVKPSVATAEEVATTTDAGSIQIPPAKPKRIPPPKSKAEEVIPFEEDGDFSEFNKAA